MRRLKVVFLALALLTLSATQASAQLVQRVIDGETVAVAGVGAVRLIGVDAPDAAAPGQPAQLFSQEAGVFLRMLVGNKIVRLEHDPQRTTKTGGTAAYVYLPDGTFVNAELVKQGYARTATSFPFRFLADFQGHEKQARSAKWGMWATSPSTVSAAAAQPATQAVTVYVTRTGEKYHSAGCRYLARSQIPMALAEAAARYGACSVCRPPIMSVSSSAASVSPSSATPRRAPVASGRCQATTQRGTQCSRNAQVGRSYCWQH
jgi:micrococcal nuclease